MLTHSVPEREDANWNGALARCTDSAIFCAIALTLPFCKCPHDDASDPTSGLAHVIQTDPLHHFNGHLRPDELLGHLPQHLVVPNAVKDNIQMLFGPSLLPFATLPKTL